MADSVKESARELIRYNGGYAAAFAHASKMLAFHTKRLHSPGYKMHPDELKELKSDIAHISKVVAEISRQSIRQAMEQTRKASPRSRKSAAAKRRAPKARSKYGVIKKTKISGKDTVRGRVKPGTASARKVARTHKR